ncbi:MAG: hypothetical protein PVF95_11225 [bacterium]|jgi:hypothetical protein
MRYALLTIFCFALATSAALAGGTPDTDDESLQMLFEFNGLSSMGLDVYAGGLGLRYFIDDEGLACRFSLNAGYRTDEEDSDKHTVSLIGGSILIEKFFESVSSVAPYVGIGFAGFYHSEKWPTEEGERKTNKTFLEIPGVAGFQWWFTDALAVGGEYRLALRYISTKDYLRDQSISDGEEMNVGFYAASVFLTVAIK